MKSYTKSIAIACYLIGIINLFFGFANILKSITLFKSIKD